MGHLFALLAQSLHMVICPYGSNLTSAGFSQSTQSSSSVMLSAVFSVKIIVLNRGNDGVKLRQTLFGTGSCTILLNVNIHQVVNHYRIHSEDYKVVLTYKEHQLMGFH